MKHFYCIALVLLLLVGTARTVAAEVTLAKAEAALAETEAENWISMFDGESLVGWSLPVFGGDGEVDVRRGNLILGRGHMRTGIRYEREFPRMNYELRYEARRMQGVDFFAACTFPVGDSFCTFIPGGWGGGTTGLSSIDGFNAANNPYSLHYNYRDETWHRFRIRVTDDAIRVWITAQDREGNWGEEESVIRFVSADRELSTRLEADRHRQLSFTTWDTEGHLRNIEYRLIER